MIEIITTINTETVTTKLLQEMSEAGSTIFRFNMSHAEIKSTNFIVRESGKITTKTNKPIKIMIDLPGPEIRITNLPEKQQLPANSTFKVYFQPHDQQSSFSIPIQQNAIKVGDRFYLQDGDFWGMITEINKNYLKLTVENSNELRDNCHFSIPGKPLHREFLSDSDKEIIKATVSLQPDFYALSFVSSAADVQEFIDFYNSLKYDYQPYILAKLEKAKALANLDEIIAISDYLYVARGDLGIEVSISALPSLQKFIGAKCKAQNKPFFIATQMMDSMINNPFPTRAEVSDVANAAFEGAAGVTLSSETSIGKHPLAAIQWMKKIIEANQRSIEDNLKDILNLS